MSAPGSPFAQKRSSFKGTTTGNVSSPKADVAPRGSSGGGVRRNPSTSAASPAAVASKAPGRGSTPAKEERPGSDTARDQDGSDDEAEGSTPAQPAKKKWKKVRIAVNLSACKYDVLRIVLAELKWKEVGDESDWHVCWIDTSVSLERVMRLAPYQRINHFHGMLDICRKKPLARNIGRLRTLYPNDYGYTPRTFVLPGEMQEFLAQFNSKKTKTYILKPDAGCQGKGISLAQSAQEVIRNLDAIGTQNVVAQRYLSKPLLINGFKFDMRIYTLTTSVDPLRVYVYKEGLARFCTSKYIKPKPDNLDKVFMHLTNYAINKHNEEFHFATGAESSEDDSKWSMTKLMQHLQKTQGIDPDEMWMSIADLVVKTIIIVVPQLIFNYRSSGGHEASSSVYGSQCFELLGFDIMLDEKHRPWLIEVNHSPSFTVDTPLDLAIKRALISDTLKMVIDTKAVGRLKSEEKEMLASRLYASRQMKGGTSGREDEDARERARAQKEAVQAKRDKMELANLGNYFPAYPLPDEKKMAKYAELLAAAEKVFHDYSYQMKVRNTLDKTRQQRVEMDKAQDEKLKARVAGTKAAAAAAVAAAGSAAPAWLRQPSGDQQPQATMTSLSAPVPAASVTAGVAAMSMNDTDDDITMMSSPQAAGGAARDAQAAAAAALVKTTGGAGAARVHVPSLHLPDATGGRPDASAAAEQVLEDVDDDREDASMNDSDEEIGRQAQGGMSARGGGAVDDASSVQGGSDEDVEGEYHDDDDGLRWHPGASFPGGAPSWGHGGRHDLEELGEEEAMEEEEEGEVIDSRFTAPLQPHQQEALPVPESERRREGPQKADSAPKPQAAQSSAEVLNILTSMLVGNTAAAAAAATNTNSNNINNSAGKGMPGKPPSAPSSHHRGETPVTHVAVDCSPQHTREGGSVSSRHRGGGHQASPGHHHGGGGGGGTAHATEEPEWERRAVAAGGEGAAESAGSRPRPRRGRHMIPLQNTSHV
eukprot:jgi/Mesvir1/3430/Mv11928-RA.1